MPLMMDHLSAWINNNQLLDRIGSENLKDLQNDIIETVFDGFENMLRFITKDYNKMTYSMHHKLFEILLTKNDDEDIYNNYKYENKNRLSISNIADDSLAYIMSFCNDNDLNSIKQTCRLFAIISRRPMVFGISQNVFFQIDRSETWSLFDSSACRRCLRHGIVPNKPAIINSLLSDDEHKQTKSNIIADLAKLAKSYPVHFEDIKNHSDVLKDKLHKMISGNILRNNDYFTLFLYELNNSQNKQKWFTLLPKIFESSFEAETYKDQRNISEILQVLCDITTTPQHVIDLMKIPELVASLIFILQNKDKYRGNTYFPFYLKTKIIVNNILQCGFSLHLAPLSLNDGASSLSKYHDYHKIVELYVNLFSISCEENVNLILNDNDTLNIMMKCIGHRIELLLDLMKVSNNEQIDIIIRKVVQNQVWIGFTDHQIKRDILEILKERDQSSNDNLLNEFEMFCEIVQQNSILQSDTKQIPSGVWTDHLLSTLLETFQK